MYTSNIGMKGYVKSLHKAKKWNKLHKSFTYVILIIANICEIFTRASSFRTVTAREIKLWFESVLCGPGWATAWIMSTKGWYDGITARGMYLREGNVGKFVHL